MNKLSVFILGAVFGISVAIVVPFALAWDMSHDDAARYGYGQPNFFITGPDSLGRYRSPAELPQLFEPSRRHPC